MAGESKVLRLRDVNSGVVVQVDEETAANLDGFEPADAKPAAKKAASSSSSSTKSTSK